MNKQILANLSLKINVKVVVRVVFSAFLQSPSLTQPFFFSMEGRGKEYCTG
jgi:hypothetical protein